MKREYANAGLICGARGRYYNVSCDYLLGRSADRSGLTLRVDEIPSPETAKDSIYHGSVLPTLNKKLISNSLNILFDKLNACPDKGLVSEISAFLMLAVYKMFRLLYNAGPKNAASLFSVKRTSIPAIPMPPCMWPRPM